MRMKTELHKIEPSSLRRLPHGLPYLPHGVSRLHDIFGRFQRFNTGLMDLYELAGRLADKNRELGRRHVSAIHRVKLGDDQIAVSDRPYCGCPRLLAAMKKVFITGIVFNTLSEVRRLNVCGSPPLEMSAQSSAHRSPPPSFQDVSPRSWPRLSGVRSDRPCRGTGFPPDS